MWHITLLSTTTYLEIPLLLTPKDQSINEPLQAHFFHKSLLKWLQRKPLVTPCTPPSDVERNCTSPLFPWQKTSLWPYLFFPWPDYYPQNTKTWVFKPSSSAIYETISDFFSLVRTASNLANSTWDYSFLFSQIRVKLDQCYTKHPLVLHTYTKHKTVSNLKFYHHPFNTALFETWSRTPSLHWSSHCFIFVSTKQFLFQHSQP